MLAFGVLKGSMKHKLLQAAILYLSCELVRCDVVISTQLLVRDGIAAGLGPFNTLLLHSDPYDCTLSSDVFVFFWKWKGPFKVDVFASPGAVAYHPETRLPLPYVSPFHMEGRVHCDALSFIDEGVLYAFPPPILIAKYLRFVKNNTLKCVVVVPNWPTAVWWPMVALRDRIDLGKVQDCVSKGRGGLPYPFGRSFELVSALNTCLWAVAFNV